MVKETYFSSARATSRKLPAGHSAGTVEPVLRRAATWVRDHPGVLFAGLLLVAWPVIVLGLADYMWFFRDDWSFIAERDLSFDDLFEPHNAHWTTVPLVAFRVKVVPIPSNDATP